MNKTYGCRWCIMDFHNFKLLQAHQARGHKFQYEIATQRPERGSPFPPQAAQEPPAEGQD